MDCLADATGAMPIAKVTEENPIVLQGWALGGGILAD